MKAKGIINAKTTVKKVVLVFFALSLIFLFWTLWGNLTISESRYKIFSKNVPKSFEGFKIVQLSDVHGAQYGKKNERLINLIKKEKPDMIAITGDLADSVKFDADKAVYLAEACVKIAPTYFVTGNHEAWAKSDYTEKTEKRLISCGVFVLRDEIKKIKIKDDFILIIGLDDPAFEEEKQDYPDAVLDSKLNSFDEERAFKLILSHRPSFSVYKNHADAALTGHVHGGQIRLPFVGGLLSPDVSLFPKYDAGAYREGDFTMIVSRGLGNSVLPIRINNRPELVTITLSVK